MTTQDYDKIGGATSTGEFGSLMKEIFEQHTEARFEWDHWGTLSRPPQHGLPVPRRAVPLRVGPGLRAPPAHHAGYSGLVYVDNDLHIVTRVTLGPRIFPRASHSQAETILDYGFADIAGTIPAAASLETDMSADGVLTRKRNRFPLLSQVLGGHRDQVRHHARSAAGGSAQRNSHGSCEGGLQRPEEREQSCV